MDFWQVHGIFFLIFITLFPRLTMLFAVTVPFGFLAWLGWLFAPHLTVAILATQYYYIIGIQIPFYVSLLGLWLLQEQVASFKWLVLDADANGGID
jgi:hypothetical protein